MTHYVGVERDITDEVQLRDQLVHSERLSAIGELVAGVAHEINNPLQTIVGSVELMIEERPTPAIAAGSRARPSRGRRAGQIVRNLLSFVRRSAPDRVGRRPERDRPRDRASCASSTSQQHNITVAVELHQRSAAGAGQPRGDPADRPEPAC